MMTPERWARFQSWRARLARRAVETNTTRQFESVLIPEPVATDYFAFLDILYKFFRIYLSLPQNLQEELKDIACEAKQLVEA